VSLPDGSSVYIWDGKPPEVIANQLWIDAGSRPAEVRSARY
jgi:hypothetical protein